MENANLVMAQVEPADIGKLAEALAAFQSEMPEIKLDSKVQVKTKSGHQYEFEYATLQNIMKKVLPVLTKNGLAISQIFTGSALQTTLMHKSGQSIKSTTPVDVSNGSMQEIGSRITYMRRYQLSPLLGIVADADDDANIADGNSYHKQSAKPPTKTPESHADAKSPMKAYLDSMAKAKAVLNGMAGSDDVYYSALKYFDVTHANEVKTVEQGNKILAQLRTFVKERKSDGKDKAASETPGNNSGGISPAQS